MTAQEEQLAADLAEARRAVTHKFGNEYLTALVWSSIVTERISGIAHQARNYNDRNDLFHVRLRKYLIEIAATALEAATWLEEQP